MTQTPRPRLWEIDALRGLAVVAMIFFHFMWDLWFMQLTSQDIPGPSWQAFARSIGGTFTFLLGLSLVLSAANLQRKGLAPLLPLLKRGLLVFGCGMLVTIGTWFFVPGEYVRFGILHHAGAAIMLGALLLPLPAWLLLPAGVAWAGFGFYLNTQTVEFPWLIPFGLTQRGVGMVDYYPLLPWFGIALVGMAAGKLLYADGQRRFYLPDLSSSRPLAALRWLGRNSLVVYLVHQPLLIGIMLAGRALGAW